MASALSRLLGSAPARPYVDLPAVDGEMREHVESVYTQVMLQAASSPLDPDPAQWTHEQRATVMGYIHGQVAVLYPADDGRMPAASFYATAVVFQSQRSVEQVMAECELLIGARDRRFVAAAQRGWYDAKTVMSGGIASPKALVSLLNTVAARQ